MRDLSDSLERENDLKEQSKFAESEAKIMRKKLSDLEEDNESLALQLHKLSSAKRVTFCRSGGKGEGDEKHVVTESEHHLRLQMELAEQDAIVLRRKSDEMQAENEQLRSEVAIIMEKLQGKVRQTPKLSPEDYNEDVIREMAEGIDKLKMKLIQKDQEAIVSRLAPVEKGILKKSRSFEDDGTAKSHKGTEEAYLKRQLSLAQKEIQGLRERVRGGAGSSPDVPLLVSGRQIPAIRADDTAVQNIELRDRLVVLEQDNSMLREKIRHLDDRTSKMSKEVVRTSSRGESFEESAEIRDLREQVKSTDVKATTLRRKVSDVERENTRLKRELDVHKIVGSAKTSADSHDLEGATKQTLKVRICKLENEKRKCFNILYSVVHILATSVFLERNMMSFQ